MASEKENKRPAPKDSGKKSGGSGKKVDAAVVAAAEQPAKEPPRLKVKYDDVVRKGVADKFGITNRLAQPKLEKIVVNVNMGRHLEGTKIPADKKQTIIDTVTKVTGQKPVVVTMRRERMWNFLDRLINLTTPRIKDFRGVPDKAFDRQGNYSFGLTEQGVFPEINMADVTFTHGMHINFVFRNSKPELSRYVLQELGMPFTKNEK
jgi:large subunit ribosomal protein L5